MPLNPKLAAIKRNLPRVARAHGFTAKVTSGYRTRAAQTRLYKAYLQGKNPYPVAVPGTSEHEKGLALDIVSNNTKALVGLMAAVGLKWGGNADPVHFQMAAISRRAAVPRSVNGNVAPQAPGSIQRLTTSILDQVPIIGPISAELRKILFPSLGY